MIQEFILTRRLLLKVTDYSSSSEDSESSDEDGETVGHDGTVAVSDIPRIMYVCHLCICSFLFLWFFLPVACQYSLGELLCK